MEMPIMTDYRHWFVPDDRFDDILSLAKSDYQQLFKESQGLGIMVSHYSTMQRPIKSQTDCWEKTMKFYDNLLDFLGSNYNIEFVTFKQVCD
jgi:hypothetical protein